MRPWEIVPVLYDVYLHLRSLQLQKNTMLRRNVNWEDRLRLSDQSLQDLKWWLDHHQEWKGRSLQVAAPSLVSHLDAASQGGGGGWGAVCGAQSTGGHWSAVEASWHINALELLAGTLAVQTFARHCRNSLPLAPDGQPDSSSLYQSHGGYSQSKAQSAGLQLICGNGVSPATWLSRQYTF